jgi:uncharacterized protein (DUF1697 family)
VARHVVLLRGINLGSRNRIAMPELRALLTDAGFEDVQTYLQSGNVVLTSTLTPPRVASEVERQIETQLGLDVGVIVRSRAELAAVVRRNPLAAVASDPKRYQVTFLRTKLAAAAIRRLESIAHPEERVLSVGREVYAWHPRGVARSKLWSRLASRELGVGATSRNWTTVTKLLELAAA